MQVIEGAGRYTPATGGEPNHWAEHMASADLSVGTYSIPAGGLDDQGPHREDEVYVVQAGAATLGADSGTAGGGPRSGIFVPGREGPGLTRGPRGPRLVARVAPPLRARPAGA